MASESKVPLLNGSSGMSFELSPTRSSVVTRSSISATNHSLNGNGNHSTIIHDDDNGDELHDSVAATKKVLRSTHDEESGGGAGSDDDTDSPSYITSPGGDEYDRDNTLGKIKSDAAFRAAPRVSHSWRYPTLLLFIYTIGVLIIFLISEYTIVEEGKGGFCGVGGFVVFHNSFLSECMREAVFAVPNCLLMLTYFFIWLSGSPWLITETEKRPWDKFFIFKLSVLVTSTTMPMARLIARASSVTFTRPDDPAVFGAMDVVQLVLGILCTIIVCHDWKYGLGHRMYIRYFWWAATLDSFVKTYGVVDAVVTLDGWDWTDGFYIVSFVCNVALSICATLGWRDGSYELFGDNHKPAIKRRGFPPFNQVWVMMKDDSLLLSIGLLLSAGQGVLLSLALTATAGLMGGDTEDKEEATEQLLTFLGYSFAVAVSTMIQQAIFGVTGQRVKRRMKNLMFKNFLLQDTTFLKRKENDTGRLTSRLLSDTERFGTAVTTQLSAVMRPLSQGVIGTGFLFNISWRLTAVVLMMAIILMIISVLRSSLITVKYSRLYSDQLARVSSRGVEVIKGIECVHQYQQEKNEHTSFVHSLDRVYAVGVGKEVRESIFEGMEHLMLATILGTGLWYGSILRIQDLLSKDDLIAFALITGAVVTSIESIMKIVPEFLDVSGPALRVCELINSKVTWDFDLPEKGIEPSKLDGAIQFENVTFVYPGAPKKTLGPGLTFQVKGGESVALVGESGCGKSTCISLVQRQYHVKGLVDGCKPLDVGRITVDGHDIRQLNRRWVLDRVGVVAQRAIMWNTTILENVAYGQANERWYRDNVDDIDAQRDRVIRALDMAAAWNEFINPSPPLRADGSQPPPGLGLYFQVGEDGCNLSGGQKQRVSIARMIYKNPGLFIFDEVTSALDAGSEKNVMRTLIDISQRPVKKSCLMIAHRLNTIKHADHIIVLSKFGNIMEETWTHMERADGSEMKDNNGDMITPLTISRDDDGNIAAVVAATSGARLVTAHEQLLRNTSGYYRRMWDDQTF